MKVAGTLLMLLVTIGISHGQVLLTGRVMDSKTDVLLDGATIFNMTQKTFEKAASDGKYSIAARERDIIIFSATGYRSDTIEVSASLAGNDLDIALKALATALDTVMVTSGSYSEDSLRRRDDYRQFYKQRIHNITGGNTSSNGFGVSISPFSFLSGKEKAKRRLKKRLAYNEQQAFIDYSFSPSYVHHLTGLSGQQLQAFMLKYRPSYTFMRAASKEDLFNYINVSLKNFRKSMN